MEVNDSTVALEWSAPAAGGEPTSYRIQAGSAPSGNDLADFNTGNASTSFTATNVASATFNLTVSAVNAAGTSAQSNNVVAMVEDPTSACDTTAGVPGNLTASASGSRITLSWTPGAEAATSYMIEAGSTTGLSDLANFDTGSTGTTFVANGVAAGTYFVRVRTVHACGIGDASAEVILVVS